MNEQFLNRFFPQDLIFLQSIWYNLYLIQSVLSLKCAAQPGFIMFMCGGNMWARKQLLDMTGAGPGQGKGDPRGHMLISSFTELSSKEEGSLLT